ncbi:hypothetical protein EV715DRAFT_263828 [Schizophyllum commune]
MNTAVSLCYSWILKPDEIDPHINYLAYRVCIEGTPASLEQTFDRLQEELGRRQMDRDHRGVHERVKLELYHPHSATGDMWQIDAVAYMLYVVAGDNDVELVLTFPNDPLTRDGPAKHQLNGLRAQFGSVELTEKIVSFTGATADVPAPWYSVGSFSQFGVEVLNLHCTLSHMDFARLLKNATSDGYRTARYPLRLYVQSLQTYASEAHFYVTRLPSSVQAHSSRIHDLSVAKVSETFKLFGLLHQQKTYTTVRVLSIDIRRQEYGEVLLALWKFQALVRLTVTCRRCQIPSLKKTYDERDWAYDEALLCPEEEEDLSEGEKS